VYEGFDRSFDVRADGDRLVLNGDARLLPFDPRAPGSFLVDDRFLDRYVVRFEHGEDGGIERIDHGPHRYVRAVAGSTARPEPSLMSPEHAAYTGHYRSHNPWMPNVRVFARDGDLWLQDIAYDELRYHERPLHPLPDGSFRVGEGWSPDRIRFDTVIDGRATRAIYDCAPMYRTFTP
jgi:hypothetical protein